LLQIGRRAKYDSDKVVRFRYPETAVKLKLRLVLVALLVCSPVLAGGDGDLQVLSRIREEAVRNSEVMQTLSHLTDVVGPRLTNSPGYEKGAEWARLKLKEWGLEDSRLEPWGEFGRGWRVTRHSLEMTHPRYLKLTAYPKAWTKGTSGVISGNPVLVEISNEEDLELWKGKLKGAIVMLGGPEEVEVGFEPNATRYTAEQLEELSRASLQKPAGERRREEYRKRREFRSKVTDFLADEGARAVLESSRRRKGAVFVGSGGSRDPKEELGLPSFALAKEQYGMLVRILEKEEPLKLRVELDTEVFDDDLQGYNVLAELPGSDPELREEIVMLGAHLDSWHAGTGATDNASGCAVVMEAVRILKAVGGPLRRTVRIALWSGEEQGLLGAKGYVKSQFGDPAEGEVTDEYSDFSAYFNLDNGAGRIRGIYLQGNDSVRPIFSDYIEPLEDLGVSTLSIRRTGGTDHLAFDAIGLPGFQFIQDPLNYGTVTHHTNLDVYEYVPEEDLSQASAVMAWFVYRTAMRDARLPRKKIN
jgi:hypothetical protein